MSEPRRFDWDEAKRLRADGLSYNAIGQRLGVTGHAVRIAVDDDARAAERAYHAAYQRRARYWIGECVDCGGPATRPPWGSGRCQPCSVKLRTVTVCPDALQCSICLAWKPDDAFPRHQASECRRGRHRECRACAAASRQRRRLASRVPCETCGELCLPRDKRYGPGPNRCRACFYAQTLAGSAA